MREREEDMKPTQKAVLKQGMIAGVLSYVATITYYAIYNAATGRPIAATAMALGTAVFGREGTSVTEAVLAFSGVHLVAWLAFGVLAAGLLHALELHPVLWVAVLYAVLIGFLPAYAFLAVTIAPITHIQPTALVVGNLVGGVVTVGYLLRVHRQQLTRVERVAKPEALSTSTR
jgi:hypothetical protein